MDEMHIGNNIIFKKLLSMKIKSALKRRFKYDIDAIINQMDIILDEDNAHIHIDTTIDLTTENLAKLIFRGV